MRTKSNWIIKSVALLCVLLMTLGLFAGCNNDTACNHQYENGVCTVCNTECPHKEYGEDGKCKECGKACEHDYNKKGVCKICGFTCKHEAYDEDGECIECGKICEHENFENGVCTACGYLCVHSFNNTGVCTKCSMKCAHDKGYEGGICKVCNAACVHNYKNGVCTICKYACKHENFENGVCRECKIACTHEKYNSNGRCEKCGKPCEHSYDNSGKCENCGSMKFPEVTLPVEQSSLPRVSVVTENKYFPDATEYVPSYDNNNPENNKDWQYRNCVVTVDNCEEKYELSQTGGFKVRGNWTTTYPKKPFRIKFDKKQNMLGLNEGGKFKSWVLLADYKDMSLERNSVALYLGNEILGTDGYYCSDFQQVELYLNGEYWGVYLLVEQQQVNKNRVNVTEPEEGYTGTDIGYFFEYDGYYNLEAYNERFSCNYNVGNQNAGLGTGISPLTKKDGGTVYPDQYGYSIKSDIYDAAQKQFIKNYVYNVYKLSYNAVYRDIYYTFNDDFTALKTYVPVTDNPVKETVSKAIDIQSLVDMYIHCEIVCDYDLYWSSFLMDVDFGPNAENNLLRFEAPWDFDSAFGLRYACESGVGLYAANKNNPWMLIFINEDWFQEMICEKWQAVSDAGVQQNALNLIYELRDSNADAYQKNFEKWGFNVSGEATWDIKNTVYNHNSAANQLYNWLNTRFEYLNSQWL